jgi:hypothetical protein
MSPRALRARLHLQPSTREPDEFASGPSSRSDHHDHRVPVAFVALSSVPSSATTYHSSGSVTFQGAVSGTLKVAASLNSGRLPGCSISGVSKQGSSEGATIVIFWNNVKLKSERRPRPCRL